jgi:hypothetical protein
MTEFLSQSVEAEIDIQCSSFAHPMATLQFTVLVRKYGREPSYGKLSPIYRTGIDGLETYLVGLGLSPEDIKKPIEEVCQKGSTSIDHVILEKY